MPIICRLIQLSAEDAASLVTAPDALLDRVRSAGIYGDVYRYWQAIEYLLGRHRPGSRAANWLADGVPVSRSATLPDARVLSPAQVRELDAELRQIQPDDLAGHYDATAFDAAGVYPATWRAWEEDFDPLGQVLEHYFFLQQFISQCAKAGAAALFYFEVLAEGTV